MHSCNCFIRPAWVSNSTYIALFKMFALEGIMGHKNIQIALPFIESIQWKAGFHYSVSMDLDMHLVLRLGYPYLYLGLLSVIVDVHSFCWKCNTSLHWMFLLVNTVRSRITGIRAGSWWNRCASTHHLPSSLCSIVVPHPALCCGRVWHLGWALTFSYREWEMQPRRAGWGRKFPWKTASLH